MPSLLFHEGDVVSCGYSFGVAPVIGRVVQFRRRDTGAPFFKVQITAHPHRSEWIGRIEPLDATWQLGAGAHQGTCERCRRPFRYETGAATHTCRRCWGEDEHAAARQSADPSRQASSWEHRQNERRMRRSS